MIVAGSTGSDPGDRQPHRGDRAAFRAARWCCPASTPISTRKAGAQSAASATSDTDPAHTHPQATLRRLMESHLRIARADVVVLGSATAEARARTRVLSEALRPAETTDQWSEIPSPRTLGSRRDRVHGDRRGRGHGRARGSARHRDCVARNAHRSAAECRPRHARSVARGAGFGGTRPVGHSGRGFGRLPSLRYAVGTPGASCRRGCCRRPSAFAGARPSGASPGSARLATRDGGAGVGGARNRRAARPGAGGGSGGHADHAGGQSPAQKPSRTARAQTPHGRRLGPRGRIAAAARVRLRDVFSGLSRRGRARSHRR